MTARLLSGKPVSEQIRSEVRDEIADLKEVHGFSPGLAVIRVGDDPASSVYVGNKVKTAGEVGIRSIHHHFASGMTEKALLMAVDELNTDQEVDGILVQLPLPSHIDERAVLVRIDPEKDVDGFHPVNAGRLAQGYPGLAPCTPAGVIELLNRNDIEIAGKHAVVIGRSNIVGKPMGLLLLGENATVTICHSHTSNLPEVARQADILVAAIGRPGFVTAEHIKEGATVVDVGINNVTDRELALELFPEDQLEKRLTAIEKRGATLIGDVNQRDAMARAGAFTPVPGGVGLLTVAMLMRNTLEAAKARRLE